MRTSQGTATRSVLRRLGRRGFAAAALAAVVLVVLATVAYATVATTTGERSSALLYKASGRVRIKNSLGGRALVGMRDMLPGDSASGTVRIGNASKARARFYLGLSKLTETYGQGGGSLSLRLVLKVQRISAKRRPRTLYYGPLRKMPLVKLGRFRPRERRQYRFTVLFPDSGRPSFDNRFQGAGVSLQFSWYARQAR